MEEEPEVDLSDFLARQRLNDQIDHDLPVAHSGKEIEEDDIDPDAARILAKGSSVNESHKGKVQQIEWDEQMEEISRLKAIAEANSGKTLLHPLFNYVLSTYTADLKARFRAKVEKQRSNAAFVQALASGTKPRQGVRKGENNNSQRRIAIVQHFVTTF